MTVEGSHVRALDIFPVLFVDLLREACADTGIFDAAKIDVIGQVDDDVAVNLAVVDFISQSLQLLTRADDTRTADGTNIVDIVVGLLCGRRLGVRIGDIVAQRTVAVDGTVGIDHAVRLEGEGMTVRADVLAPSTVGGTRAEQIAELARSDGGLAHHRSVVHSRRTVAYP